MMTDADLEELLKVCPTLYHMASDGAWDSIRENGLRSTSSLLDLYDPPAELRSRVEDEVRGECIRLESEGRPSVVIRDQCAMCERKLASILDDGLEVRDWCRILNGKVFFWLTLKRLDSLLDGAKYREDFHDVLEVKTASLVRSHRARIRLCPYNSGNTRYNPPGRGLATFRSIETYPYDDWKKKRSKKEAVAELTVEGQVEDILDHTVRVVRRRGKEVAEERYSI